MIRVAIAAASDVAAAGLSAMLSSFESIVIVGRAADAQALAQILENASPDVLVLDDEAHADETSSELLVLANDAAHRPAVVVLSDDPPDLDVAGGRAARGRAFLPRRATAPEIEAAVRAANAGLVVFHPELAAREARVAASPDLFDGTALTPRETEVLRMLAAGLPNKSIAVRLNVSAHTVKFHVGSIMAKLHASSRTEAVTEGIRRGLIFI
ncbi:MAG TPA: response regulator transcription factor [Candidatus Eremiobacteraceae bacterium]|nr:response regulator transcription factor [Candidatus Eremiobacteraceae bacterium]